jgi:hypothetical protein
VWSNTSAIELRAGTLSTIALTAENVTAGLRVRWKTYGRGWEVIPARYLYSATLTDRLRTTYLRFLKMASLAGALKLTARELSHFAASADYRIGNRGWANSLPVTEPPEPATSAGLLQALDALLDFAALKAKLAPGDGQLLDVLDDRTASVEGEGNAGEGSPRNPLLALTRWDGDSLDALLVRFGHEIQGRPGVADRAALKRLPVFVRVSRAYGCVKRIGISAPALLAVTSNEPRAAAVSEFKAALRARYAETDWLNVLRPINDEMRALQRDALVAYTLHHVRAHAASAHVDTPEKLFEYFLMDVQTAPCMQTSRVRHALSSVQSFIERCFMNLETRVDPSIFDARRRQQWGWMKRYRLWEANRKIFLWPENWVEAELRSDQSPFFREALSELLQGDITEERAATALVHYLSRLREVATLEPCGVHYVEGDAATTDDIVHVVARSAGANPKYFYRRFDGLWTAWEPIPLDLADGPVLPVLWKNHLLLFWVKVLVTAPIEAPPAPPPGELGSTEASEMIPGDVPKVDVQAMLCWSEYYNGKWQPARTSSPDEPALIERIAPGAFQPSRLSLQVAQVEDTLNVLVFRRYSEGATFAVHNLHGLPESSQLEEIPLPPRRLRTGGSGFIIEFEDDNGDPPEVLLTTSLTARAVQPHHDLARPKLAPFLYADNRHVFYVTPEKVFTRVQLGVSYGLQEAMPQGGISPLIAREFPPPGPGPYVSALNGLDERVAMQQFVSEDAYISKGIATTGAVPFGNVTIGPTGRMRAIERG